MRQKACTDKNQGEIVHALRKAGASVLCLHQLAGGCPDLLIGYHGRNILMEIKNGAAAELTPRQVEWHRDWCGQVAIVRSVEEALALLEG